MKTKDKKLAIILIGPPGAGKGTQAALLADKFGLKVVASSKIIRQKFRQNPDNPEVKEAKIKYDKGELISPETMAKWTIEYIQKTEHSVVFDGTARTLYEAKNVYPELVKKFGMENVHVIYLDIAPKTTIFRNTHRKVCENEKCRQSIVYSSETKKWKFCPKCGYKLIVRKLDNLKIIKQRLKVFKRNTGPAIAFFARQAGGQAKRKILKKVDGEPSAAEVFASIVQVIE